MMTKNNNDSEFMEFVGEIPQSPILSFVYRHIREDYDLMLEESLKMLFNEKYNLS